MSFDHFCLFRCIVSGFGAEWAGVRSLAMILVFCAFSYKLASGWLRYARSMTETSTASRLNSNSNSNSCIEPKSSA
ncbi:hypothetical protein BDV10DRAFT_34469 [Aspergillus recurvatus]